MLVLTIPSDCSTLIYDIGQFSTELSISDLDLGFGLS